MSFTELYKTIFDGDDSRYIKLTSHNKETGFKGVVYEKGEPDWNQHLTNGTTLGRSPIKIIKGKGVCRWIGLDRDEFVDPVIVTKEVWATDPEIFCFGSTNGKWHYYKFYDDFISVEHAIIERNDLIRKFEKLGHKFDLSKCLPKQFDPKTLKTGSSLFTPKFMDKTICYDPRGNPLTREKFEFRFKVRHHPLVAGSVGLKTGDGLRADALFQVGCYLKHNNIGATLYEVNDNFSTPMAKLEVDHVVNTSLKNEDYDKEHLLKNYSSYTKNITGVTLPVPASYQKVLTEIPEGNDLLKKFKGELEETPEQKEFFKNVIYMNHDDWYYDNSKGIQYKTSAIKTIYGHLFPDPIKDFRQNHNKKLVELGVYRPDQYVEGEDPITSDEEGLLYVNHYQPSKIKFLPADTPQRKEELSIFLELVRKLTEHEKEGWIIKNGEKVTIDLYEYVLDHLSMNFQRPGVKVRNAILWHSFEKQLGKNTLMEIIRKALGYRNCTIISPQNAVAREKTFIEHQLVFIDEIKIDGTIDEKKSTLNILKPLMTNELHDSRPLFKEWRQVHSTLNVQLATNHKDACAFDHNEQRYTAIDIGKTREEMGGDEFLKPIVTIHLKTGTMAEVVKHYLLDRTISPNFDPGGVSIKTKFLEEMIEAGGHPMFTEVKTLFNQREEPFDQSVISINDAWLYCKKNFNLKGKSNDFTEALARLGAEDVGECKHNRTGKKPCMKLIRNHGFFADKTKSEIVNKYWKPTDTLSDNTKWNLTAGDVGIIDGYHKEISAYEDFHDNTDEKEQDIPYIEIKRAREKK